MRRLRNSLCILVSVLVTGAFALDNGNERGIVISDYSPKDDPVKIASDVLQEFSVKADVVSGGEPGFKWELDGMDLTNEECPSNFLYMFAADQAGRHSVRCTVTNDVGYREQLWNVIVNRSWYVREDWVGESDGSIDKPMKTVAEAVGASNEGDTILVWDGERYSVASVAFSVEEAREYSGYLVNENDELAGTITVKVGKEDESGKSQVTVTVTDLESGEKDVAKGTYDTSTGVIKAEKDEKGLLEGLVLTEDGLVGSVGDYAVQGALDVSSGNNAETANLFTDIFKSGVKYVLAVASGTNDCVCPYIDTNSWNTFTIQFKKRGKAKVSGILADGTKVSITATLTVYADNCVLPVMYTKKNKGGFGFAVYFDYSGNYIGTGLKRSLTWIDASKPKLAYRAEWRDFICGKVDPTYIPVVTELVCMGDRVAGVVTNVDKKRWQISPEDKTADNKPKISYAVKNGSFSGGFKIADGSEEQVLKSAKMNGVAIGGKGYGSIILKRSASLPVLVH